MIFHPHPHPELDALFDWLEKHGCPTCSAKYEGIAKYSTSWRLTPTGIFCPKCQPENLHDQPDPAMEKMNELSTALAEAAFANREAVLKEILLK